MCDECRQKADSSSFGVSSFQDKRVAEDIFASDSGQAEASVKPRGREVWRTSATDDPGCRWPIAVAITPAGEILVLDTPEDYRILRYDTSGNCVGALIEIPAEDEEGGAEDPVDLCVDGQGRIYVPDVGNDRIAVWQSDGTFSHWIGGTGSLPGQFLHPSAVDVDVDGMVYVADTYNRRIQRITPDGLVSLNLSEIGDRGSPKRLVAITVDAEGNIYVADSELGAVFRVSPDGQLLNSLPASTGAEEMFDGLCDVRIDSDGSWCVADARNMRIRRFDPAGNVTGIVDLRQEDAASGDTGDIALLEGKVLLPDRTEDRVLCMEFESVG